MLLHYFQICPKMSHYAHYLYFFSCPSLYKPLLLGFGSCQSMEITFLKITNLSQISLFRSFDRFCAGLNCILLKLRTIGTCESDLIWK